MRLKGWLKGKGKKMRKFNLTSVIWAEEGVYVSRCPELGVASCGDTPEEALGNLKEAVELYLDNAKELGLIANVETAFMTARKFTSTFEVTG